MVITTRDQAIEAIKDHLKTQLSTGVVIPSRHRKAVKYLERNETELADMVLKQGYTVPMVAVIALDCAAFL